MSLPGGPGIKPQALRALGRMGISPSTALLHREHFLSMTFPIRLKSTDCHESPSVVAI